MNEGFDLQNYLIEGVEGVVKEAIKATIKNPRESAFMLKFAAASRAASKKRRKAEDNGEHIPPFLIVCLTEYPQPFFARELLYGLRVHGGVVAA